LHTAECVGRSEADLSRCANVTLPNILFRKETALLAIGQGRILILQS